MNNYNEVKFILIFHKSIRIIGNEKWYKKK